MAEILEFKKSFIEFSVKKDSSNFLFPRINILIYMILIFKAFFTALMRDIEVSLDPWNPAGNHIEE